MVPMDLDGLVKFINNLTVRVEEELMEYIKKYEPEREIIRETFKDLIINKGLKNSDFLKAFENCYGSYEIYESFTEELYFAENEAFKFMENKKLQEKKGESK